MILNDLIAVKEKELDIEFYNELLEQQKKKADQSQQPEPLPEKEEPLAENSAPAEPCVTPPSTPSLFARVNEENERSSAEGGRVREGRGEVSCATPPSPLGSPSLSFIGKGRGEASCVTPPVTLEVNPEPLPATPVARPLTIAEKLHAEEMAKPKPDLRKLLRGTSTTGPSKVLRRPIAA